MYVSRKVNTLRLQLAGTVRPGSFNLAAAYPRGLEMSRRTDGQAFCLEAERAMGYGAAVTGTP